MMFDGNRCGIQRIYEFVRCQWFTHPWFIVVVDIGLLDALIFDMDCVPFVAVDCMDTVPVVVVEDYYWYMDFEHGSEYCFWQDSVFLFGHHIHLKVRFRR
jgi:hypothetical protein